MVVQLGGSRSIGEPRIPLAADQPEGVAPDQFEQQRRDLLRLMAMARSAFFQRQPEPPQPPWAPRAASGFGRHRQGPAHAP